MATTTINPVAIAANVEKDSPGITTPVNVTGIVVQLTDSAGNATPPAGSNWLTTAGNIKAWGVQASQNGGGVYSWYSFAGDPTGADPTRFIPFGALGRDGKLPRIECSSTDSAGNPVPLSAQFDHLRLAVLTDTGITLGAVVTTTP